MGARINRTLKNWRWWATAPLYLFVGLPLSAVLIFCDVTRTLLIAFSDAFVPMNKWVRRGDA